MTHRTNIYNKLPEGYIPPEPKAKTGSEISLLRQGSVTEITLDGKAFQVYDPQKVERLIQLVERHDETMFSLRQDYSNLKRNYTLLEQKYAKLSNTVNKLQEQIKNAGFDRF